MAFKELKSYLKTMVEKGGSDLYLLHGAPPTISVEGKMETLDNDILDEVALNEIAKANLESHQYQKFVDEHEINIAIREANIGRFRANFYHTKGFVACVVRHIVDNIPTPEELSLPSVLSDQINVNSGLMLVVGATGVGKSTTIASLLNHRIKTQDGHVVTIEDPIEFVFNHAKSLVSQREIGIDTVSYNEAMTNALRQAPSVIFIGEIRSADAMEKAIMISQTGHLCVATMHANNTYQALERIANFFPADRRESLNMDLSFHLSTVVSQRLVPTKDGGRRAIFEVMHDTPFVKELLKRGEFDKLPAAIEKGETMQTFESSLETLVKEGIIELEEAMKYADSANNLRLKVGGPKGKKGSDTEFELVKN